MIKQVKGRNGIIDSMHQNSISVHENITKSESVKEFSDMCKPE